MAPDLGKKKVASRAWKDLTPGLSEWVLEAVASTGFDKMTPVQASTIPLFMGNKDVVVEAVTGSGKTLSFLIPIVERLLRMSEPTKRHHINAIVVSPTRELATQIHTVLNSLLAFHSPSAYYVQHSSEDEDESDDEERPPPPSPSTPKIVTQLLLGGTTSPAQDLSTFLKTSPNFLVATPGRLSELLRSQHVHATSSSFDVLVLDEADRLLDLGFSDDLSKILAHLPKQRRTGLFSASVSEAVDQLIRVGLRNPVRVTVKVRNGTIDQRTPASLTMAYAITSADHKIHTLIRLLRNVQPAPLKSIVYVSTCAAVDYFQHILPNLPGLKSEIQIVPLHGKHSPNVRQKNFTRFLHATSPIVLLTTDVAARGLDIPAVDLVVQIDPPSDPKVFLHRCGRAGRAGRRGLAIVLLTPGREEDYIPFLAIRKTPVVPISSIPHLTSPTTQQDSATNNASPLSTDLAASTTSQIRALALADRAVHDKAQRAFVSWVRAYSKHVASSIFSVRDLDWDALARGWGLLRMPRMPELKGAGKWAGDPSLGLGVDWAAFGYRDKVREAKRKEELLEGGGGGVAERLATGKKRQKEREREKDPERLSWSEKKEIKELREARRERKRVKRGKEHEAKLTDEQRREREELQTMIEEVRRRNEADVSAGQDDSQGFKD